MEQNRVNSRKTRLRKKNYVKTLLAGVDEHREHGEVLKSAFDFAITNLNEASSTSADPDEIKQASVAMRSYLEAYSLQQTASNLSHRKMQASEAAATPRMPPGLTQESKNEFKRVRNRLNAKRMRAQKKEMISSAQVVCVVHECVEQHVYCNPKYCMYFTESHRQTCAKKRNDDANLDKYLGRCS